MKAKNTDLIMDNQIFLWIAAVTGFFLMIPLLAMQLSNQWNWDSTDFIIAGVLLFGTGSLFVLAARVIRNKAHRIFIGIAFLIALLYLFAELAVGIFTNWGN